MAKTSRKKGRSTETGPFVTGQEETLQPRREEQADKKLGRIKKK